MFVQPCLDNLAQHWLIQMRAFRSSLVTWSQ